MQLLEKIKQSVKQQVNPVVTTIEIETSQAVGELDEHFKCSICLNVVIEPKECATCNHLNCGACFT